MHLDSRAHARQTRRLVSSRQQRQTAERLRKRRLARAAIDLHTAARGDERPDVRAGWREVKQKIVMDGVRLPIEGGFGSAALDLQASSLVVIPQLAAEGLVHVVAEKAPHYRAGFYADIAAAGGAGDRRIGVEATAAERAHFPFLLRPAGRQVEVGDFPVNIAMHPEGKFAAILHCGYGQHEIKILDTAATTVFEDLKSVSARCH